MFRLVPGDLLQQRMALLLVSRSSITRIGLGVGFVYDDQVRAMLQQQRLVPVTLGEIHADDQVREVLVGTSAMRSDAVQLGFGAAAHYLRIDVELLSQLLLPLVAEVWR